VIFAFAPEKLLHELFFFRHCANIAELPIQKRPRLPFMAYNIWRFSVKYKAINEKVINKIRIAIKREVVLQSMGQANIFRTTRR
jgi:hypothetical protein